MFVCLKSYVFRNTYLQVDTAYHLSYPFKDLFNLSVLFYSILRYVDQNSQGSESLSQTKHWDCSLGQMKGKAKKKKSVNFGSPDQGESSSCVLCVTLAGLRI